MAALEHLDWNQVAQLVQVAQLLAATKAAASQPCG